LKLLSATLLPDATSHIIIAPSKPPLAMYFPSELQVRAVTSLESAFKVVFI